MLCWPGPMLGLTWSTGVTWLYSGSDESLGNIFPVVITAEVVISVVKYFQMVRNHSLSGRVGWALSDRYKLTEMCWRATQDLSRASPPSTSPIGWLQTLPSPPHSHHWMHLRHYPAGWRMAGKLFAYVGKCEIHPIKLSLLNSLIRFSTAYRAVFLHVLQALATRPRRPSQITGGDILSTRWGEGLSVIRSPLLVS